MKKQIISIIICGLLNIGTLIAGTIDPRHEDSKYTDLGKEYISVGLFSGIYEDGSYFEASAIAINDNTILTAAHIVKGAVVCKIKINDEEYIIKDIRYHHEFQEDFGNGDIAIGFSNEKFLLPKYPELYSDENEKDKLCVISGYGMTGSLKTGSTKSDNKKRAGYNKIDEVQDKILLCVASDDLDMEFLISHGDSGGGLFIGGRLAGINSCVMATDGKPNSSYSDESVHTRISKYIPWIKERIDEYERKK